MLYAGYPEAHSRNVILPEPTESKRIRCIDNTFTDLTNCSGYCMYEVHPGYLTKKLIAEHSCHEKECKFFYFLKSDERKIKKTLDEPISSNIMAQIAEATKKFEGMRVIKIELVDDKNLKVSYASITHYDLEPVIKKLSVIIGMEIQMYRLNLSYDKSVELVFGY